MKIISGGQNGADIGAVEAARFLGFETGGWMPKGWVTLDGPRPLYETMYGMKEHSSPKYPPRTFMNVRDSDATLRIAADFESPGEKCTQKAINQYKKLQLDIDILHPLPIEEVVKWLQQFQVVNVAGNSEKTFRGMTHEAFKFMRDVLLAYKAVPK